MIKFLPVLFISILCTSSVSGQLPDDFIAPNFIVTDLDGDQHELYKILDSGKTVILDIYTTWCGPCWNFHNQHVLEDIWNEMGPNGTDEVFIMSIESDLTTDMSDLDGTGMNTLGNWIEGTPYPMVDELVGSSGTGQIAIDYMVWGYPTIYFICPSRKVTDLNWQTVAANYKAEISDCPITGLTGTNNCRLEKYFGVEGAVCDAETFAPSVSFRNMGTENVESATFAVSINGNTNNYSYQGDLAPYYAEEIEFPMVTAESTDVIVEIIEVNGVPDDNIESNIIQREIVVPLATNQDTVIVEILTDDFGAETYWVILNESDKIVAEGGNLAVGLDVTLDSLGTDEPPQDPNAYESGTLYTTDVYLPTDGCYRFIISDYYLDGICCENGDGYFMVKTTDGEILVNTEEFMSTTEEPFAKNGPLNTTAIDLSQVEIFPNPFLDRLIIRLPQNHKQVSSIMVNNVDGSMVQSIFGSDLSGSEVKLDLSNLASGIYLVEIHFGENSSVTQKIVKL